MYDELSLVCVIDVGGGFWYVELLIDVLVEKVWEKFIVLEWVGGVFVLFDNGVVDVLLVSVWDKWVDDFVYCCVLIIGVSEYVLIIEMLVVWLLVLIMLFDGLLLCIWYV